MPRAAVVELDDCLSKPINLLSVVKYSSTGRDSIWVVQEEVLCQGLFPRIFPGAGSPCPVPSMGKAPPFSQTLIPHLACCRQCEDEGAEAESWVGMVGGLVGMDPSSGKTLSRIQREVLLVGLSKCSRDQRQDATAFPPVLAPAVAPWPPSAANSLSKGLKTSCFFPKESLPV